jgi:Polyketide cyclase / dehydrase and lipid transport
MSKFLVNAEAVIDAPAERVYAIIADYRNGHPHILPKPYFSNLQVDRGGVGAGTHIHFQMRLFGTTRDFRAEITEPQPGRVLVEAHPDDGTVTTFTVKRADKAGQCHIMITTELNLRGPFAFLQRWLVRKQLTKIFRLELAQLAEFAKRSQ